MQHAAVSIEMAERIRWRNDLHEIKEQIPYVWHWLRGSPCFRNENVDDSSRPELQQRYL